MERQIQKLGVRKWYADNFLKLQNQLFMAIEAGVLGDIENVILNGIIASDNGSNFAVSQGYCFIDGKVVPFEGIADIPLPAYLYLDCTESTFKEYADGIAKPTELICIAKITTAIPNGEYIKIADDANVISRLLLPKYNASGALSNLPTSNALTLDSNNHLATAKTIKILHDLTNRKYLKENFNNGEIDLNLIPSGHTWLGKNGLVKINEIGEIVGNTKTTDKFVGYNAPKILAHISSDGEDVISSKGSIEISSANLIDGGTGIFSINIAVPLDAILMVSHQAPIYSSRIQRHPTTGYPLIETFDSNNNYINGETHISIYY